MRAKFPLSDYRYIALGKIAKEYLKMADSDKVLNELIEAKKVTGNLDEVRSGLRLKAQETFLQILENKALEGTDEHFDASKELAEMFYQEKN